MSSKAIDLLGLIYKILQEAYLHEATLSHLVTEIRIERKAIAQEREALIHTSAAILSRFSQATLEKNLAGVMQDLEREEKRRQQWKRRRAQ